MANLIYYFHISPARQKINTYKTSIHFHKSNGKLILFLGIEFNMVRGHKTSTYTSTLRCKLIIFLAAEFNT